MVVMDFPSFSFFLVFFKILSFPPLPHCPSLHPSFSAPPPRVCAYPSIPNHNLARNTNNWFQIYFFNDLKFDILMIPCYLKLVEFFLTNVLI